MYFIFLWGENLKSTLTNFQVYNALLTVVTKLYSGSPKLNHPIQLKLCTLLSPPPRVIFKFRQFT
jgi:hypothetical protein